MAMAYLKAGHLAACAATMAKEKPNAALLGYAVTKKEMMQALAVNGISFESHIYAYGPHGFSTCDSPVQYKDTLVCSRVPWWVPDSIAWLKEHKEEVAMNIRQAVYDKTVTQGVIGLFLSISAKPLEEVLGYTGLSDDDVKRIDDTLRKIPN